MSKSKRRSVDQTKTGSPESLDVQRAPTEKKINRLLLFFQRKRQPKVRSIGSSLSLLINFWRTSFNVFNFFIFTRRKTRFNVVKFSVQMYGTAMIRCYIKYQNVLFNYVVTCLWCSAGSEAGCERRTYVAKRFFDVIWWVREFPAAGAQLCRHLPVSSRWRRGRDVIAADEHAPGRLDRGRRCSCCPSVRSGCTNLS